MPIHIPRYNRMVVKAASRLTTIGHLNGGVACHCVVPSF